MCPIRLRRSKGGVFVVFAGAATLACSSVPSQPASPFLTDTQVSAGNSIPSSQFTVGLRVATDETRRTEDSVRLQAVVYDVNGSESVTDLGEYRGDVSPGQPVGPELVRVVIVADGEERIIRLVPGDACVEARRGQATPEDIDELIRRIPVPEGVRVLAREPSLEETH